MNIWPIAIEIINDEIAIWALAYDISKWIERDGSDGTIKFNVKGASPVTAAKDQIEGGVLIIDSPL